MKFIPLYNRHSFDLDREHRLIYVEAPKPVDLSVEDAKRKIDGLEQENKELKDKLQLKDVTNTQGAKDMRESAVNDVQNKRVKNPEWNHVPVDQYQRYGRQAAERNNYRRTQKEHREGDMRTRWDRVNKCMYWETYAPGAGTPDGWVRGQTQKTLLEMRTEKAQMEADQAKSREEYYRENHSAFTNERGRTGNRLRSETDEAQQKANDWKNPAKLDKNIIENTDRTMQVEQEARARWEALQKEGKVRMSWDQMHSQHEQILGRRIPSRSPIENPKAERMTQAQVQDPDAAMHAKADRMNDAVRNDVNQIFDMLRPYQQLPITKELMAFMTGQKGLYKGEPVDFKGNPREWFRNEAAKIVLNHPEINPRPATGVPLAPARKIDGNVGSAEKPASTEAFAKGLSSALNSIGEFIQKLFGGKKNVGATEIAKNGEKNWPTELPLNHAPTNVNEMKQMNTALNGMSVRQRLQTISKIPLSSTDFPSLKNAQWNEMLRSHAAVWPQVQKDISKMLNEPDPAKVLVLANQFNDNRAYDNLSNMVIDYALDNQPEKVAAEKKNAAVWHFGLGMMIQNAVRGIQSNKGKIE